jgi:hypothetical protein
MDGKLILGFLNYLFFALIFIFGFISLLVREQKRKLTFLFLALLSSGVLSYLFFAGIAFILPGIILIFFCLLLYMLIASQEFYAFGKPIITVEKQQQKDRLSLKGLRLKLPVVISFLLSLAVTIGAGIIFFIYTNSFFKDLLLVKSFKVAAMEDIINNIGANYIPAVLVLSIALFSSVFWFISILGSRRAKN